MVPVFLGLLQMVQIGEFVHPNHIPLYGRQPNLHIANYDPPRVGHEGYEIPIPKIGLGYTPEQPAQIWIKKRSNALSSQYITVEVGESSNQRKDHSSSRVSVFDRIEASLS